MICIKLAHLLLCKTQTKILGPPSDSFGPNLLVNAPFNGNGFLSNYLNFSSFPYDSNYQLAKFQEKILQQISRKGAFRYKYNQKTEKHRLTIVN